MSALEQLEPGRASSLRPIQGGIALMADKGFAHSAQALAAGGWEVLFTPAETKSAAAVVGKPAFDKWPEPSVHLDNRDLEARIPLFSAGRSDLCTDSQGTVMRTNSPAASGMRCAS